MIKKNTVNSKILGIIFDKLMGGTWSVTGPYLLSPYAPYDSGRYLLDE